jgi:SAM-dependent methyltransferase
MFTKSPDLYSIYHHGFRTQCKAWPVNPVDVLIKKIKRKYETADVADLGCGDAAMEKYFRGSGVVVHSFDLVGNDVVVACDIAHTPLKREQVDVVVFSLSLMGTNYLDFIKEAWRVVKYGGRLMIAEVESRFSSGGDAAAEEEKFIGELSEIGFGLVGTVDKSHKVFVIMEFEKVKRENAVKKEGKREVKKVVDEPSLRPCMYKKR